MTSRPVVEIVDAYSKQVPRLDIAPSPSTTVDRLVAGLARVWSNGRVAEWPFIRNYLLSNKYTPIRLFRRPVTRDDGLLAEVKIYRWTLNGTVYMFGVDEDDSLFIADEQDVMGATPAFYDTKTFPVFCKYERWKTSSCSPYSVEQFICDLRAAQTVTDGELDSGSIVKTVTIVAVNVLRSIYDLDTKKSISSLDTVETILSEIPCEYWPVFLCCADDKLYTA
jgi:hypothetical protein